VRDPQILLLLPLLARAHRHAPILRTNPVDTPELSAYESRLTPRAAKQKAVFAQADSPHYSANLRVAVLDLRLGRDRKSPPIAERLGGDLDSRRRLLPFVLAALHHPDYPLHQTQVKIVIARNLFGRTRLLHVVFENRIERLVRRK